MRASLKLARFSWALYDLANTIFSANIISFYFALWLTVDRGVGEIYYSLALAGSIFLAALLMPILGEITDRLKARMPFLIAFTLGCVIFTALLGLVKNIFLALSFFAAANLSYQLAGIVYNSLLPQVSPPQILGRTSGLGVSLGYLGTILGLLMVRPFLETGGRQATFIPTAVMFLVFALPALMFIKDLPHPRIPKVELELKSIFFRLKKSILQIRQNPSLLRFFTALFLCLNATSTIIVYMGIYANRVMHFNDVEIIYFMIVSTLFAVGWSYLFGYFTDKWGSRSTLNLVLKLWCLSIFGATIATFRWMFWTIGALVGICLGGTWVSARTMLVELVPKEKIGQMFGLLGLVQMFSFILGPVIWGVITTWLAQDLGPAKYRVALSALFIFMFSGYLIFQKVGPLPNLENE